MCQTWRTLAVKSISVWPLRSLNMQRPYWTSLSTQQDALDVSMAPKTQQDLSSIYGNGAPPRTTPPPLIILPAASQISYLQMTVHSQNCPESHCRAIRWVRHRWVSCKCYLRQGREMTLTAEVFNLTTKPPIHLEVEAAQINMTKMCK